MSAAAETPATEPSPSGRLLGLVRKLIDYGRELAATIRQRTTTDPIFARCRFGTTDLAQIFVCIARGLQLANALEARVLRSAAQLDAGPAPGRNSIRRHGTCCAARCRRGRSGSSRAAHSEADRRRSPSQADRRRHRRYLPRFRDHGEPSAVARRATSDHQARRQPCPPGVGHPRPGISKGCAAHSRIATTQPAVRDTRRYRAALKLSPDDRGVACGAHQGSRAGAVRRPFRAWSVSRPGWSVRRSVRAAFPAVGPGPDGGNCHRPRPCHGCRRQSSLPNADIWNSGKGSAAAESRRPARPPGLRPPCRSAAPSAP